MDDTGGLRRAFAGADKISLSTDDEAIGFFNRNMPPGMSLLGAVCEAGSRDAGELRIAYHLDSRFANPVGFLCGGYIAQMLDQAAAYASSFVTGKASPSLDLKVSFLAPARPGTFTAVGKVIKAGGSIAFLEAKLTDASKTLIATGAVTAQLIPIAKLAESAARGAGARASGVD